jgi:hypothetical protein
VRDEHFRLASKETHRLDPATVGRAEKASSIDEHARTVV